MYSEWEGQSTASGPTASVLLLPKLSDTKGPLGMVGAHLFTSFPERADYCILSGQT